MSASTRRFGGPLAPLVTLFSSIWFGVILMSLLFVYSSVGSAGVPLHLGGPLLDWDNWIFEPVRQRPGYEMTEFEWFHWWPFDLLIALICTNIVVATLRRIRLNTINLGVWMIHTGILVLCFGSYLYFGNKVEGLTPVPRRNVVATTHTGASQTFVAVPNNPAWVGTPEHGYSLRVFEIDRQWVIPEGPSQGEEAYAVQVVVRGPHAEQAFIRQLVDGHPELTHDLLIQRSGLVRHDEIGDGPLYDTHIELDLEPFQQNWFYLSNHIEKAWAVYLREQGTRRWYQRPVEGLPLFTDTIGSSDLVWMPDGDELPLRDLDLSVPRFEEGDPLGDQPLHVKGYLRYAHFDVRDIVGPELNPICRVTFDGGGGDRFEESLAAFDAERASVEQGFLTMVWASSPAERDSLGRASEPTLRLSVPGGPTEVLPIRATSRSDPDLGFASVGDYSYRVEFIQGFDEPGMPRSVCSVEIRGPGVHFRRWLSEDPGWVRDIDISASHSDGTQGGGLGLMDGEPMEVHAGLDARYTPGNVAGPVTIVAGPSEDDLGIVVNLGTPRDGVYHPLAVGEAFGLGRGAVLTVDEYLPRSQRQLRPEVVARRHRDQGAGEFYSKAYVQLLEGGGTKDTWVPHQQFPTEGLDVQLIGRGPIQPARMQLDDGRVIELLLSSQRLPLGAPAMLDDFYITSHDGGYTGGVGSIMDWTSVVRFGREAGGSTDRRTVSVNAPIEDHGLWFYQAQWDRESAPRFQGDPGSMGLNYTVLGVGNRVGVGIQLLGCCIAVLGMLYAFYVKPILIKRRVAARTAEILA